MPLLPIFAAKAFKSGILHSAEKALFRRASRPYRQMRDLSFSQIEQWATGQSGCLHPPGREPFLSGAWFNMGALTA